LLRCPQLAQVDQLVGAERRCQVQPLLDAVHHDHPAGPKLARRRRGEDAESPRALHHHRLAKLHARHV
jgi:hypothetical protein